jgi:hypothetical protein
MEEVRDLNHGRRCSVRKFPLLASEKEPPGKGQRASLELRVTSKKAGPFPYNPKRLNSAYNM